MSALFRPGLRLLLSLAFALGLFGASLTSSASVFVSVNFAPPPLPVYEQPLCPGPSYIWVPGYWAYGPYGYYWVPGTWVLAPFIGALWTPGYWGWSGSVYVWHAGYWGPHVGFYGGIDYGFGYFGVGYVGGYWNHGAFYYNTAVTRVDTTIVNYTYARSVAQNATASRVSYNGGAGGVRAQPTAQERIAVREAHRSPTPLQVQHERLASRDRALWASQNHGSPALAATPRPAAFGRSGTSADRVAGSAAQPSHIAREPHNKTEQAFGSPRSGRELGAPPERHAASRSGGTERHRESQAASEHRADRSSAMQPAPEKHAQTLPRSHGASSVPATPRAETQVQSMPRRETAPHMQAMPRAETHARSTPAPQMTPRPQAAPRSEMRAQEMPHPQAAPRSEMHAQDMPRSQAAPHPQGRPREDGAQGHDERRGG